MTSHRQTFQFHDLYFLKAVLDIKWTEKEQINIEAL